MLLCALEEFRGFQTFLPAARGDTRPQLYRHSAGWEAETQRGSSRIAEHLGSSGRGEEWSDVDLGPLKLRGPRCSPSQQEPQAMLTGQVGSLPVCTGFVS